jgi:hypothetical protein
MLSNAQLYTEFVISTDRAIASFKEAHPEDSCADIRLGYELAATDAKIRAATFFFDIGEKPEKPEGGKEG